MEHLECYFMADDVANRAKRRSMLLNAVVPPRVASFGV